MNKTNNTMLYPQVDYEKWAKIYDLGIKSVQCEGCGGNFTTNKPFAMRGWRGLETETHGCGERYVGLIAKEFDKSGKNLWAGIVSLI